MRHRFEPVDEPPIQRLLDSLGSFERVGDLVAVVLMPVYLVLVVLVTWFCGFCLVSTLVAGTVAANCWPASRGLRALRGAGAG